MNLFLRAKYKMDRAAHRRAFRGQTVTMEQAARGEAPAAVPSVRTISLGRRLRNPFLADALAQEELGTWALDAQTINFLEQEIAERQPDAILEFGSGISTLCLARFMMERGHAASPCVFSIEQNEWQIENTQTQLAALGLQPYVRQLHAPLTAQVIEGTETECYDLPEAILREFLGDTRPDFAVVDGPCGDSTVRFGTLPLVKDALAPNAVFFLDDAFRPEEREVAPALAGAALSFADRDAENRQGAAGGHTAMTMSAGEVPRITFGIIVLNGEPFTRYNLAALYPFAHQIIVVEGAAPSAAAFATPDGHSQDGTREVIRRFQNEEDPEGKVTLVTAEDEGRSDGFWMEKDEMSQAYAKRATGNYLWQVDMDEFYRPEDIKRMADILEHNPAIQAVTFQVRTFWGSLEARTDGVFLRRDAQNFHRLFAWGPGFRYAAHRPPTVLNAQGQDLREVGEMTGEQTAKLGVFLYHYSFLFPFQVRFKLAYYGSMDRNQNLPLQKQRQKWHDSFFTLKHPFYIDDTSILGEPSWLVRFRGEHPPAIAQLWKDIEAGQIAVERRPTEDMERLLNKLWYRLAPGLLLAFWTPVHWARAALRRARRLTARRTN